MATIKDNKRDKFKHSFTATNKTKGAPRKGGAGTKGAWGTPMDDLKNVAVLDEHDPNYDSSNEADYTLVPIDPEPEEHVRQQFQASIESMNKFKQHLDAAVQEFLLNHDKDEFVRCVGEFHTTIFHQEIPFRLVLASFDKSEEARKKVSGLLRHLFQKNVVTQLQMTNGFQQLFNRLGDLALDVPNVEAILHEYAKAAAAAEILDEPFVAKLMEGAALVKDPETVRAAKKVIRDVIEEYFDSEDLAEASLAITEMKTPHFHHEVVKQVVSLSMDRTDRERELASYMLAVLTSDVLDAAEVQKGFELLLHRVEDLYNDVPKVFLYLSCFLARAVADECLVPAFLSKVHVVEQDMAYQVVKHAEHLLKQKRAAARLQKVWGPGDGRSVLHLKQIVVELVEEYYTNGDLKEAEKCVKELNAPYFHHEVVKRLVFQCVDKADSAVDACAQLIKALLADQVVSQNQVKMGFGRIEKGMPDLILDAPAAQEKFQKISAAVALS